MDKKGYLFDILAPQSAFKSSKIVLVEILSRKLSVYKTGAYQTGYIEYFFPACH